MKKFLTFTLCIAMVSTLLTGCGNGNAEVVESNTVTEEVQTVEPEVEVEPTEEVKEDSDAEKDTPEEEAEEKTFADTGLTEEYAVENLSRAIDAYKKLYENKDKVFETNVVCYMESARSNLYLAEAESKDGYTLGDETDEYGSKYILETTYESLYLQYFDNYINNNGEYYDFTDYYKECNYLDLVDYSKDERETDTSKVFMWNTTWIPSITIKGGETSIENITDDISIQYNDIWVPEGKDGKVAWQCDIYVDGEDTGLKMVFDKDGNFLNINDEEAKIEFVNVTE